MSSMPAGPPSMLAVTLKRGLVAGRLYLIIGVVISLILAIILLRAKTGVFAATFPLEVPLFAALGATGGIVLFASDRAKGVLEYAISYGLRPGALLANVLVVTVALAATVLGAALAIGLGAYVALGNSITSDLTNTLLLYSVPMAFASALFATVAGMISAVISSPRGGLNNPAGITPLLAVAPPVIVLLVAEASPQSLYYYITAGTAAAFGVLAILMLVVATRVMDRERYLSPM